MCDDPLRINALFVFVCKPLTKPIKLSPGGFLTLREARHGAEPNDVCLL